MKKTKSAKGSTYKTNRTAAHRFYKGGVSDESISERASEILTRHEVDSTEFVEWLARRLGRYRDSKKFYASIPGGADQAKIMASLADSMDQVRSGVGYGAIPPHGEAIANEVLYRVKGEHFFTLLQRLQTDLTQASAVLRHSATKLESQWKGAGRRRNTLRDSLLSDLTSRLQAEEGFDKFEATCAVAAEILQANGIPCPQDDKEAAKRVRQVRRGEK